MDNSTTTRFLLWVRETLDLAETLAGSSDPLERQLGLLLRTDIDTALTAPSGAPEAGLISADPSRPETVAKRRGRPAGSRIASPKPSPSANGELPEGGNSLPFGEPTTMIPARGESGSTEGPYVN
jgi:hypothetical protein